MTTRRQHPKVRQHEAVDRSFAALQPGGDVENRRRAICGNIEAIGRETQAEFLATKTDEPIVSCIEMLASQPTDEEGTARRIAAQYLAGRRNR